VRVIVVDGAGTIGMAAAKALSNRHEVAVAGRRSGTAHVDSDEHFARFNVARIPVRCPPSAPAFVPGVGA
jgi:nucleoside-diphosphate-sugar epimerase